MKRPLLAATLAVSALVGAVALMPACGGGGDETVISPTTAAPAHTPSSMATLPPPTPTLPPPTPTAIPEAPLPSGWTRNTAEKLQIGVPTDWVATPCSPEFIDAAIEAARSTNPQVVPSLEAIKQQQACKFLALDPSWPTTFVANLIVGLDRPVLPVEDEVKLIVKNLPSGVTADAIEEFTLRGERAARLEISGTTSSPTGESVPVEVRYVVVNHAGYCYNIVLTYRAEYAEKYRELFDSMIQTITFTP